MRAFVMSLLVLAFVAGLAATETQGAPRKVIFEEWTSSTCPPCVAASATVNSIMRSPLGDSVAIFRNHVYWPSPGNDPFWYSDSAEIRRKLNWTGPWYWTGSSWSWAIPWAVVDGDLDASYTHANWAAKIRARAAVQSPLTLSLSGSYNRISRQGRINVQIVNTGTTLYRQTRIRYVLTESGVRYNGVNGETVFYQAVRDWIPNEMGDTVTIAPSATINRGQNFTIGSGPPNGTYMADSCQLVVFVQNDSTLSDTTREVLQGSWIWVRNLPSGVEASPIAESRVSETWLGSAEPTPFTASTRVSYTLPSEGPVSLAVYNLVGAKVRSLASGQGHAGSQTVTWDGRNDQGARVPQGVYFFELRTPYKSLTARTVVVR